MKAIDVSAPAFVLVGDNVALMRDARVSLTGALAAAGFAPSPPRADFACQLIERDLFSARSAVVVPDATDSHVVALLEWVRADDDMRAVLCVGKLAAKQRRALTDVGVVVIDVGLPGKGGAATLLKGSPFRFDASATSLLVGFAGEDPSSLLPCLALLGEVFAAGVCLSADDVRPYLTVPGSKPPWALTDAIDARDTLTALSVLADMLPSSAPLAVCGLLARHVDRLRFAQLSDGDAATVAALCGGKADSWPVRRACRDHRRWGDASAAAMLVARATDDLKGHSALPANMVLEVLVARLSRRSMPRR